MEFSAFQKIPASDETKSIMNQRNTEITRDKWPLLFFLAAFSLFILAPGFSLAQSKAKLKTVVSLFPLQEFAQAVGGERVHVDLILPPGAEPHAWEPKPSDLAKIYKADLFIYIGRDMEPWAEDLLKATRGTRLKAVEASRGLPLLEAKDSKPAGHQAHDPGRGEKFDPHVWLDFSLDIKIVDMIADAMSEKDPGNAASYRANAEAYKNKLDGLEKKYRGALSNCRHRQIILGGHSAFAYLAKRYGLQQIPLYGISPNAEPTPRKLTEVITAAKNQGVKFIFFEELVNPKLARVLAQEAGIQTLVLHNGANLTREQLKRKVTFLGLMEENLLNLRKGLGCGSESSSYISRKRFFLL